MSRKDDIAACVQRDLTYIFQQSKTAFADFADALSSNGIVKNGDDARMKHSRLDLASRSLCDLESGIIDPEVETAARPLIKGQPGNWELVPVHVIG